MKPTTELQSTRKLLLEMFTTSRGHNLVDSGCAYGYSSDHNQRLGLDRQPFLLKQEWETGYRGKHDKGVHVGFLVNTLKYIEAFISGIHEPLQTACDNNFVGKSYPKDNLYCYIDGGFYSKGKSVCDRHTIRREVIEDPIIKQVAQIVDSTVIADRLAARIEAFLQVQSSDNSDLKRLERQIADNQLKIDRLFNLVVEAGIDNDTAIPKIRELEADKVRLMKLLQKEEQTATRQVQIPRVAREAVDFMKGFHKYFAKAPIQERKQLIRHFIQSIRVRPEDRQIDAILTKIPTTDPTFLQVVRSSEQELRSTSGSAKSSGGAIFSAVTRLEYYTSISLQELHNFDKRSTGVFLG